MGTCRHKWRRDLAHQHEQLNSKLCILFILFYFSLRRRHGRQGAGGGGEAGSSTAWQDTQLPDGDMTSSAPVAMAATQRACSGGSDTTSRCDEHAAAVAAAATRRGDTMSTRRWQWQQRT